MENYKYCCKCGISKIPILVEDQEEFTCDYCRGHKIVKYYNATRKNKKGETVTYKKKYTCSGRPSGRPKGRKNKKTLEKEKILEKEKEKDKFKLQFGDSDEEFETLDDMLTFLSGDKFKNKFNKKFITLDDMMIIKNIK